MKMEKAILQSISTKNKDQSSKRNKNGVFALAKLDFPKF